MSDPQAKDTQRPLDIQPQTRQQERRTQVRKDGVLAQIEDATYAILRKHEDKRAYPFRLPNSRLP
jgi:hypothetical protein